jgi:hypothetical protein
MPKPKFKKDYVVTSVVAVIINFAGEVLLTKRNIPPFLGQWVMPGGKIDLGEPIIQAQQIQGKIESYGYTFPEFPNPAGTILPQNGDKPKLGIWLMPNNQYPGMLEDFLMPLANPDSISLAAESVKNAKKKGVATFKECSPQ